MADTARKITAESLHARLPVGEVARFDEQLVSRFHLLHEETGELATPPVFVAFDCMCLPQALDVRAIRRRETVNRSHRPCLGEPWSHCQPPKQSFNILSSFDWGLATPTTMICLL